MGLEYTDFLNDLRFLPIYNDSGEEIPARALVKPTGTVTAGPFGPVVSVEKPDADNLTNCGVNGPTPIPIGGYGNATWDSLTPAAYNTGDGTPALGGNWGTENGGWYLRLNKTGYRSIGTDADGISVFLLIAPGITSLNGLTGATQTFSVTATGTDFTITSSGSNHTFDLPSAAPTVRGVVTTAAQEFAGIKKFIDDTYWLDAAGGNVIASIVPAATGLLLVSGDEIGTGSPTWVRLDLDQHTLNRCRLWSVDGGTSQNAQYAVVGTGGTTYTGIWESITVTAGDVFEVSGGLVTDYTAGGGGGGSGGGGSTTVPPQAIMPGGRLTLTSGTPAPKTDVTAGTILYYAPYMHDRCPIWNGSAWVCVGYAQFTISLAALTSGKVADVFLYLDGSGNLAGEIHLWTNDTTRATAISYQDGRLCKSGDKTRLYIGTVANNSARASLTVDDADGFRGVWNFYWRVPRRLKVIDSTDSWTTTTTAWHALNSSNANRVSVVIGVEEVPVELVHAACYANSVDGLTGFVGIGLDSTSANSATIFAQGNVEGTSDATPLTATYKDFPGLGLHYLQLLEAAASSGTATFYGDGGAPTKQQCGGLGWVMA